uniref:Uncharacterized protein n=1 Tax=Anguilla anguilla TaxID=7936 RepID=A0A0E9QCR1_ANGAN
MFCDNSYFHIQKLCFNNLRIMFHTCIKDQGYPIVSEKQLMWVMLFVLANTKTPFSTFQQLDRRPVIIS